MTRRPEAASFGMKNGEKVNGKFVPLVFLCYILVNYLFALASMNIGAILFIFIFFRVAIIA